MWNICRWQTNNYPQPCVYEINNYVNNSCRINISHLISCRPTDHRCTALWWRRNSGKFYTENTVFLVIILFFHNGILIMRQHLIMIFQFIIHVRFLSLWNVIVRRSVTICLNAPVNIQKLRPYTMWFYYTREICYTIKLYEQRRVNRYFQRSI